MTLSSAQAARMRELIGSWIAEAQQSDAGDVYAGKRQARRYTWPVALEVRLGDQHGSSGQLYATGRDISDHGVGIFCRQQLQTGTVAWIRLADQADLCPWLPTRVAHATQTVGGYRIGLRFALELADNA